MTTSQTPEERREAQIESMLWVGDTADAYDALLAYFDEHEPAVADAIRYGVFGTGRTGMYVDYPEGHEKR